MVSQLSLRGVFPHLSVQISTAKILLAALKRRGGGWPSAALHALLVRSVRRSALGHHRSTHRLFPYPPFGRHATGESPAKEKQDRRPKMSIVPLLGEFIVFGP